MKLLPPVFLRYLTQRGARYFVPAACGLALAVAFLATSGCNRHGDSHLSIGADADPVEVLQSAIEEENWQLAREFSAKALVAEPNNPDLVTQVATVAAFAGEKREAAGLLVEAAQLAQYQPASRVTFAVQALIDVGDLYAAIDLLEASLRLHSEEHAQRRMLVSFLNEAQLTDRVSEHLRRLIERRQFDLPLLMSTTETSSRRLSDHTASTLLARNPADHRIRLSTAFVHLYRRDAASAAEELREILAHHPSFTVAHSMYGQALTASSRWSEIPTWIRTAPSDSEEYADYWLTLGDIARRGSNHSEAARAYWEAARRDPNRLIAWDRLRLELQQLVDSDELHQNERTRPYLTVVAEHSNRLLSFREKFNHFAATGQTSQTLATEVARSLLALGRTWEAEAWAALATTLRRDPSPNLAGLREAILAKLQRDSSWFAKDTPAISMDLSYLAIPHPKIAGSNEDRPRVDDIVPRLLSENHLRMTESSEPWGLKGTGEGNCPADGTQMPLTQTTGSGAGAIDYDLDGLPDLVVMNAAGTILLEDSKPNDLMRNIGGRFVRVTDDASVADHRFGQGVAVGDFNEDGFADLFFANLGPNRLFQNNGDGTFSDRSDRLMTDQQDVWSTSASFVDINGDSVADLVVTNYCQVVGGIDRACTSSSGVAEFCHPLKFPAATDQFFLTSSDGKLVDITATSDGVIPGRGLGVVTGTLSSNELGIYVANDMSRNALYTYLVNSRTVLTESALTRGLAVDGRSQPQASMGIAASDFDLDGDLDFYVTGFAREYNVYYEQISPGLWSDETSKVGLVEPTLMSVGFGTQAIDLDNDGINEIMVTNGHIGDFADAESPPYEQPLQIFRRASDAKFALVGDDSWGAYFRDSHVGRSLLTIDVNRDGRDDVVVSHSHEQIRLLINETSTHHSHVAFKLAATRCSRDAVGAIVTFVAGGKRRTLWALSGDGYLCSNERTLRTGVGPASNVSELRVTWPDGSVDNFGTCDTNAEYLLIQGESTAFLMSTNQ